VRLPERAATRDLVPGEPRQVGPHEMNFGQVDPCAGLGDELLRFGEDRLDLAGGSRAVPGYERPGTDQVGGAQEGERALTSRQRRCLVRERSRPSTAPSGIPGDPGWKGFARAGGTRRWWSAAAHGRPGGAGSPT